MKLARFVFLLATTLAVSPGASAQSTRVTLQAAITEALDKNLDLLARRAGVSIADANILTARLRPNPVLSLGGDHLDLLGTGFDDVNGAGPPEYSARVDLLIERAGKRGGRVAIAQAERGMAEADLLDAMRALRLDVERAYVDLQLAQRNLALAHENTDALNAIVTLNQARVRAGDLAEVELLRSRVAALQSQQTVREAQLTLHAGRRRLEGVMGRTPGATAIDIEELPPPPPITDSVADLQARALRHRPDLAVLRRMRARSQADIRLQRAQGRADVTLGAEYRRQQGLAGKGNSIGLFVSTPIPFFDRNQGGVARAREEARQAETRVRAAEQAVLVDVDLAAAQLASASAALRSVETDMLPQAKDVRTITDYAYRRGEATLIELLDVQRAFNETMRAWNEARADYARSVFAVRAAMGEEQHP